MSPIDNLRRSPAGPDFLLAEIRPRVHSSVSDETVVAVLVPALSYVAMLARQSHLDGSAAGVDASLTWQDVCDWLVGIVGRYNGVR